MEINKRKQNEINCILYFCPEKIKDIEVTKDDIIKYFEYTEQGKHKEDKRMSHFKDGFNKLLEGVRWRGIHIQMWEDGIMDESVPYPALLGWFEEENRLPDFVVNYMKKAMFKGVDAQIISYIVDQYDKETGTGYLFAA